MYSAHNNSNTIATEDTEKNSFESKLCALCGKLLRGIALIYVIIAFIPIISCSSDPSTDIANSSQVLAKVGKKEITINYFNRQQKKLPTVFQEISTKNKGKRELLNTLIDIEILYEEAKQRGIDKDHDIIMQLKDIKKEMMINALVKKEIMRDIKLADPEAEDYYNEHLDEFKNLEEIRFSNILVKKDKDAQEIIDRLKSGEEFANMALLYSLDRKSAKNGGDNGYRNKNAFSPEFKKVIQNLEIDGIGGPIKIPLGYQVIKLTGKRIGSYTFEQSKNAIKKGLFKEKFKEKLETWIEELKKDKEIQIFENTLSTLSTSIEE